MNTVQSRTPEQQLSIDAQANFIVQTYLILFGAIAGFVALEFYLFSSGYAEVIFRALTGVSWLLVLGAFMLVGMAAGQVAALAATVVAWGIIFVPLLYIADAKAPGTISSAAQATLIGFAFLTAIVFFTRKDFSFLRTFLVWGGLAAIGLIIASILFGFSLGNTFSIFMVAFAGAAILYDTSNVLHRFRPGQEDAAALQLFGSVALMFWYVLQLFMSRD